MIPVSMHLTFLALLFAFACAAPRLEKETVGNLDFDLEEDRGAKLGNLKDQLLKFMLGAEEKAGAFDLIKLVTSRVKKGNDGKKKEINFVKTILGSIEERPSENFSVSDIVPATLSCISSLIEGLIDCLCLLIDAQGAPQTFGPDNSKL